MNFSTILPKDTPIAKRAYIDFCEKFLGKFDKKNLHKIISLLTKFHNNFALIESFIKILYKSKQSSIENQKDKKAFINNCKELYNITIIKSGEMDQEMSKRYQLVESLLISMILEESKKIEDDTPRKGKEKWSLRSFNSFRSFSSSISIGNNNIFSQMTPSIPLIRAIILELYIKIENEKKYKFIAESEEITPVIRGVKGIIYIDKEMKEFIVSLVYFFECILDLNENKECLIIAYSFFSEYLENVISLYKENMERNNSKRDKIICTYLHLFQSNKICTDFYISFYKKLKEDKTIEKKLKNIINFLFYYHPCPFIFTFLSNLFTINKEKFFEFLSIIFTIINIKTSIDEKAILKQPISFYLNIVNYLWLFHNMIYEQNIKDEKINSFFNSLFLFILNYSVIYIPFLFRSPFKERKEKKTIYELIVDIILSIDPELIIFSQLDIITPKKNQKPLAIIVDSLNRELSSLSEKKVKFLRTSLYVEYIKTFKKNLKPTSKSMLLVTIRKMIDLYRGKCCTNNKVEDEDKTISFLIEHAIILFTKCKNNNAHSEKDDLYQKDLLLIQENIKNYQDNKEETIIKIIDGFKNNNIDNTTQQHSITNENSITTNINEELSFDECPLGSQCLLKINSNDNSIIIDKEEETNSQSEIKFEVIDDDNKLLPSFYNLDTPGIVLCTKRDLFLKNLSVFFTDVYFNENNFKIMKKVYQYKILNPIKSQHASVSIYDEDKFKCNYPTILRNYSSPRSYYPRIFLKQNLKFYKDTNFLIGHSYFLKKDNTFPDIKFKPIFPHFIQYKNMTFFFEDQKEEIDNSKNEREFEVEYLNIKGSFYGKMRITKSFILFISQPLQKEKLSDLSYLFRSEDTDRVNDKEKKILIINSTIAEVLQRRFLFNWQGVEFFLYNGKSYFFNFLSIDNRRKFFTFIKSLNIISNNKIVESPKNTFKKKNYTKRWNQQIIDNFHYLLYINKYGSRSYNDLNQYPIIPWISLKSKYNDISDKIEYVKRNFEFAISAQKEDGKDKAKGHYSDSLKENTKSPSHFRLHYSTMGYVLHYLFRLSPYTESQIRLQNKQFESPNRQFHSFDELIKIQFVNYDNRELLPELFIFPEYFYNLNYNDFGKRIVKMEREIINNLVIPQNFKSPTHYIILQRNLINSKDILTSIHLWIDNVFGKTQSDFSLERINTFNKYSYEQKINLIQKLEKMKGKGLSEGEINNKLRGKIMGMLAFGQTPSQIFNELHPKWELAEKDDEHIRDEIYDISDTISKDSNITNTIYEGEIIYLSFTFDREQLYVLIKSNKPPYSLYIKIFSVEQFKELYCFPIDNIQLFRCSGSGIKRKHKLNYKDELKETKISNESDYSISIDRDSSSENQNYSFLNKSNTFEIHHFKKAESESQVSNSDTQKLNILELKYALFDLDKGNYFIVCRNIDNCIKIYKSNRKDNKSIEIFYAIKTKSFVSALLPIPEILNQNNSTNRIITSFFSGHRDGKLIEWGIDDFIDKKKKLFKPNFNFTPKRDIIAHNNSMITAILYINRHQLIITCADDGYIHIRKFYDFELINVIYSGDRNKFYVDCFYTNKDLLYMKLYDKSQISFKLLGYTLNGLNFTKTEDKYYSTLQVTKDGFILSIERNSKAIKVMDEADLEKFSNFKEASAGTKKIPAIPIITFLYDDERKASCYYAYANSTLIRIVLKINEK